MPHPDSPPPPVHGRFVVEPLARHRALIPTVAQWFVAEWPAWYGPGGPGHVLEDLQAFAASEHALPVGMLVFQDGKPVGAGALKAQSIPSHAHLGPWAAAGYVLPSRRGQGLGAALLQALVDKGQAMGHAAIYCGTSTAQRLLVRQGWQAVDTTMMQGKPLTIYCSPTVPQAAAAP